MDWIDKMARQRALQMAQSDWANGRIEKGEVIGQARLYEQFIIGEQATADVVPLRLVDGDSGAAV